MEIAPVHPGEILAEEFLKPMGITEYRLAKTIGVPPRRINEIVKGRRGITADTSLRFARAFGVSDMYWLNIQARYDADMANDKIAAALADIQKIS